MDKKKVQYSVGTLLKRVSDDLDRGKLIFLLTLFIVGFTNICVAFAPKVSQGLINHFSSAVTTGDFNMIWIIGQCILLWVLYFVGYGAQGYINRYMVDISQELTYNLRNKIQEKINRLPINYLDTHPAGNLVSILINDIQTLSSTIESTVPTLIGQAILLLSVMVMMVITNWKLAGVYIISLPLTVFLTSLIAMYVRKSFVKVQNVLGGINNEVEDVLSNHPIVKSFGCEEDKRERFDKLNKEYFKEGVKSRFILGFMLPIGILANNVSYIILCVFGGYLLIQHQLDLGAFTAFIFYGNMVQTPLSNLASSFNLIQAGIAGLERVYQFLDEEEMPKENPNLSIIPSKIEGKVNFNNVNFGYLPEQELMKDVSFSVEPGMTIAIVGPSGAGKTTLINLLMRFYEINDGNIYLDGVDTATLSKENLRSAFGMVLQDTWIFNGTIAENIGYGKPNATQEEIIAAAKLVRCHEFIEKLPEGYDTEISEENSILSVGQKQLLSIARTVLANPQILILDEATSNVDTKTEYLITMAMEEMMKDKTSFVIAHRLFTIQNADKIIFMVDGDIKEVGSHDELMNLGGLYYSMYKSFSNSTDESDNIPEATIVDAVAT